MDVTRIISEIDAEISRLQQARAALSAINGTSVGVAIKVKGKRGRPKGSTNKTTATKAPKAAKKKRNLSPEGRKAIADAMKRRWAERRKAVAKK